MAEAIPEPARDPNPFHHAAALVEKMDRHDVEALGRLVLERLETLRARDNERELRAKRLPEGFTVIHPAITAHAFKHK